MTLTPLNAIRERAEATRQQLKATPFYTSSPTLVCELLDTQERLIRALELAMAQRENVHKLAMPHDCWHFTSQDAAIAAILELKDPPRPNEKGDHERD